MHKSMSLQYEPASEHASTPSASGVLCVGFHVEVHVRAFLKHEVHVRISLLQFMFVYFWKKLPLFRCKQNLYLRCMHSTRKMETIVGNSVRI